MASSLELNKMMAGVLTAEIIASASGIIAGILYHPQHPEEHAFSVAMPEGTTDTAEVEEGPSFAELLATADPAAGQTVSRQCAACHTFEKGGADGVGPHLYGVLGRDIASVAGFNYSDALQGLEGSWDFDKLENFVHAPRDYAPGTNMSFAGLRRDGDRANLLAYLNTMSDSPLPLPEPEAADDSAAADETAPATGEGEAEAADAGETATAEADAGEPAAEAAAADAAGQEDEGLSTRVAAADPAEGERLFRQCAACHTAEPGGANRVGPALYGVFGRDVATADGFNYSDALQGIEGEWDAQKLYHYLEQPREFAPGNRMAFAGVRKSEDRVALIAYLHSLADQPVPLD